MLCCAGIERGEAIAKMLFVVFSAGGGIRTDGKLPVFTTNYPVLAYGIMLKGGKFVAQALEDCLILG